MNGTIDILGTKHEVRFRKRKEDPRLENLDGYYDPTVKLIVACEFEPSTDENVDVQNFKALRQKVLRHEIVHAFLYESGLHVNANVWHGAWPESEEMVDWFAIQGPKIYAAWQEADCL